MADAIEPNYTAIYAEIKDGAFTVPAMKYSDVDSAFLRKNVSYATREAPGTIVIDPPNHYLYHVEDGGRATRYGVGVGREGFAWAGRQGSRASRNGRTGIRPRKCSTAGRTYEIDGRAAKRDWDARRPRQPVRRPRHVSLAGQQRYYFRIHGTNEPWTIGSSQSSGCIRMINQDAMDLYKKTPIGTRVVVLGFPGAVAANASHV